MPGLTHPLRPRKRSSKTPQSDIDLVKRRLKDAERDHAQRYGQEIKS